MPETDEPLPTTEELVACPPTEACDALLRAAAERERACPEDSPRKARLLAEADEATRLYKLALRRDHQLARRHELGPEYERCVCLGRGGRGPELLVGRRPDPSSVAGATLVTDAAGAPVRTWTEVCSCPDGQAAAKHLALLVHIDEERRRRAHVARVMGGSGIPAAHARRTRKGWLEMVEARGGGMAWARQALDVIEEWEELMADPDDDRCVLLLAGDVGTGKTSLAGSVALTWVARGRSVLYRTAPTLAITLRSAPLYRRDREDPPTPTAPELIQALLDVELLVLDDLGAEAGGTEREGDRLREWLYAVLVGRIDLGRPTVVTTNLNKEAIQARYDVRVADRLFSGANARRVAFQHWSGSRNLRADVGAPAPAVLAGYDD